MTLLLGLWLVASPADQLGFGAAGAAVASAAVAAPSGVGAAFYNPAAAPFAPTVAGALGYSVTTLDFTVNGEPQALDPARALTLGLVWPISLGRGGHLAVTGALSLPDQRILRARVVPTEMPRFLLFDNRLQRLTADGALGWGTSLGALDLGVAAGLSVLTGGRGHGVTFTLKKSGELQQAEAAVDVELPSVTTPIAALWARRDALSVGGYVRGPIEFDLAIGTTANIRFGPLRGDIASSVVSTDFFTPLKAAFGVAWQPGPWALQAALEWHRWSAASPLTATWVSDVEVEGLEVPIPEGQPARQRFRDVWSPRLGVEVVHDLGPLSLSGRAGASYESTPVRGRRAGLFLDADRFGGSIGLGVAARGPVGPLAEPPSIDFYLAGSWMRERRFLPRGPTDIRPAVVIGGHLLSGGATLTLQF